MWARNTDLHGHDLADSSALDQDNGGTDASSATTAVLATLDVCDDDGVRAEDRQGDDAGAIDLEPVDKYGKQ